MRRHRSVLPSPHWVVAVLAVVNLAADHAEAVNWVGPNASFWDLSANWSPTSPVPAEDAQLGAFDTTLRSGTFSVRSVFGAGEFSMTGGTLTTSANSLLTSFNMSSGQVAGTGSFAISGDAAISFGGHSGTGTTRVLGATSITSTGLRLDGGRIFRNEGTVTQTGNVDLNNRVIGTSAADNGTVLNAGGGIWNTGGSGTNFIFATNQGAGDTGAGATFTNVGTFNKVNAGTTTVSVGFDNIGAVGVQAGELGLDAGGNQSGTFDLAAGAVLGLNGTHNFNGGSATSPGTLRVQGGVINLNTNYGIAGTTDMVAGTLNSLFNTSSGGWQQSGGQVTGGGTLTISGSAAISFGGHSGAGTTRITSTGLRLDGGRIFRNEGTVTQTGNVDLNNRVIGTAVAGNGTVLNAGGGIWNTGGSGTNFIFATNQGAGDTGAGAIFTNTGTFNKVSPGTTTVSVTLDNTGTLSVQEGLLAVSTAFNNRGTLDVAKGAIFGGEGSSFTNSGQIRGLGTIRAAVGGSLQNAGLISPGDPTGPLTLEGGLVMGAGSRVEFGISTIANFDRLVVSGATLLSGTLELVNLGYTPALADGFTLITYGQRLSGSTFSQVTWTGFAPGVAFTANYGVSNVRLVVTAVPEP